MRRALATTAVLIVLAFAAVGAAFTLSPTAGLRAYSWAAGQSWGRPFRNAMTRFVGDWVYVNTGESLDSLARSARLDPAAPRIARLAGLPSIPVVEAGDAAGGDEVIVYEFVDYNCGFCRRFHKQVQELAEIDRNIKLLAVQYPVLGDRSMEAASVVLAAGKFGQALQRELHMRLSAQTKPVTREVAMEELANLFAGKAPGLSTADLDAVMPQVRHGMQVAAELGVRGTPSFLVGDRLIRGFQTASRLARVVDSYRSRVGADDPAPPERSSGPATGATPAL